MTLLKLISRSVIKFPWRIFIFFPFNYALYRPALTFGSSPWIYHLTAFIETFSLVIAFLLLLYTYKRLMVFSPSILFILQFFTSLIRSNRYTFLLMKVQYLCFKLSHAKYRSSSLCLSIWDVSKVCHRSWYSPDKTIMVCTRKQSRTDRDVSSLWENVLFAWLTQWLLIILIYSFSVFRSSESRRNL